MKVTHAFRDDSNDVREGLELEGFSKGKFGREAMKDGVVSVEQTGCGSGGDGGERGDVPVLVGGENRGFGVMLDLDNEGSWLLICRRRGCKGEEREETEKRKHCD